MILSRLVEEVKKAVSSTTSNKWTDEDIASAINIQVESVTRKLAETDQKYTNAVFVLPSSGATQLHSQLFAYNYQPWLLKISEVRHSQGDSGFGEGPLIDYVGKFGGFGWSHGGANELWLRGWSSAIDLEIHATKVPARLTRGTLGDQAAAGTNQILLDADDSVDAGVYPHESLEGAYIGALVEITGVAGAQKGQVKPVIASTPNQGAGNNQHLLTVRSDWTTPPVSGDTYELRCEIPTQHSRLIVLLAARQLHAERRNFEAINAFAGELSEQWMLFINTIKKRDIQQPIIIRESLPRMGSLSGAWPYSWDYE